MDTALNTQRPLRGDPGQKKIKDFSTFLNPAQQFYFPFESYFPDIRRFVFFVEEGVTVSVHKSNVQVPDVTYQNDVIWFEALTVAIQCCFISTSVTNLNFRRNPGIRCRRTFLNHTFQAQKQFFNLHIFLRQLLFPLNSSFTQNQRLRKSRAKYFFQKQNNFSACAFQSDLHPIFCTFLKVNILKLYPATSRSRTFYFTNNLNTPNFANKISSNLINNQPQKNWEKIQRKNMK